MDDDDLDPYCSSTISYLPNKFEDIWQKTKELFNKEIKTISDLNTTFYKGDSDFFTEIEKSFPEDGNEFLKVYNNIRSLVLDINNIFEKDEFNLLISNTTDKIILTRKQVALIFILGFFDIFSIDIEKMCVNLRFHFGFITSSKGGANFAKGRSFLNYMTTIGKWLEEKNKILEEKVTYIRETKDFGIENIELNNKLCEIEIIKEGSLFDSEASFCVDFANKYIGGGALEKGCVQEEILFAVEPEAVVSMFLMKKMADKDAIRIDNLIQYSKYSGYGLKFTYEGNAINSNDKLIKHNIIAIDAVVDFKGGLVKEKIERDLIKAYIGFDLINFDDPDVIKLKKTIATGNWGCGAFGGDFEIKFIQQWLAATFAGVDKLYYYTFKNPNMEYTIQNLEKLKSINAYDLYLVMMETYLEKGTVLETIMKKCDNKKYMKELKKLEKNNKKKNEKCNIY